MTKDDLTNLPICGECGASKPNEQAECWLCGAAVTNPFQSPNVLTAADLAQPPDTIWNTIDNVIAAVLVVFLGLSVLGALLSGAGVLGAMVVFLIVAPGVVASQWMLTRQKRNQSTGFFGSKTFAVITGGLASACVATLLVIALIVLLCLICASQGPMI